MGERALIIGLLLAGAATAHAQSSPVIGPGNEPVVTRMLAADLPAGCTLEGASIAADRIDGRFACDSGQIVIQLRHVDDPRGGARRTERFRLDGPTGPLLDAVEAGVRAHEAEFTWSEAAEPEPTAEPRSSNAPHEPTPPRVRAPLWQPALSAVVLLLLLFGVRAFMLADGAPRAPIDHVGLLVVLAVGFAARAAAAWWLPWDTDEVSSLPSGGWQALLTEDHDLLLHPPLHRLLLAIVPGVADCPPRWLPRVVSVIPSTAAIGLVYAVSRRDLGPRRALLPAALLALTPLDVFVGALARPYALVGFAVALFVWGAWPAATARAERRHWVGVCAALGILAWTDYFAATVVGLLAVWLLVARKAQGLDALRPALAMGGASVIAGAPWIPFALAGLGFHGTRHAASGTWPLREGVPSALAALGADWAGGALGAALVLALLAVGLRRRETWGATAVVVGLAVLLAGLSQHLYLRPRNVAFLCVPLAVALGLAWAALPEERRALPLALAILLLLARFEQPVQLVRDPDARPPSWASELVLADGLAAMGRRLPLGESPVLVDVEHDTRVVSRNLFEDRCLPVREPTHEDVTGGAALGAVRECRLPEEPERFHYLQRHRCDGTPAGCSVLLRGRFARLFRCEQTR